MKPKLDRRESQRRGCFVEIRQNERRDGVDRRTGFYISQIKNTQTQEKEEKEVNKCTQ